MTAKFIQIHTLTSYPASLLNRDDAGFAKRMPFGCAVRTRVSSQCLKRHWRMFDGESSLKTLDAPESVRSRISFEKFVVEPLVKEGVPQAVARAAAEKLVGKVFGGEAKQEKADKQAKKVKKKDGEGAEVSAVAAAAAPGTDIVKTDQVTVLGRPELDYLCGLAREACKEAGSDVAKATKLLDEKFKDKDLKKNIAALKPGSLEAGLGAALFGRMVTGDILARTDAAIHVAHAMTVHGQMTESDYFSAIDDLTKEDGESASGHINAAELTSGLFYGYVVVDVELLVANLGGDRKLAADVVQKLVHILATVSPGAKKGSTAPYANSHFVFVEAGKAQPRTLANAFLEPVDARGNLVERSYQAMAGFLTESDRMYGRPQSEQRVHAGLHTGTTFGETSRTLAEVAQWAQQRVLE
ncbi:MAG: type I-E CRISPR-associated protein Cas7/Cse4/CasC [Myxococcales bacterium]